MRGSAFSPSSDNRHADARERRAQLVAAIGEQQAMRGDQLLDAPGRAVEAFGQCRHLVAPLDLNACAEIAAAQPVDTGLQALDAAAQPPHHGPGAERGWRPPVARGSPRSTGSGLGRSRTWRATSQRPSGNCRVKVEPSRARRQPTRAR